MRLSRALFPVALAIATSGCSKGEPRPKVTYGEPVGVQMAASRGLPAYEMALAVTAGVDVATLVSPVSKAVHDALAACPSVVARGAQGEGAEVAFSIEGGRTSGPPPPEGDEGCLLRALVDREIVAAQTISVLVQLRFGGAPKAASSASP